jgi:hypothetical protein
MTNHQQVEVTNARSVGEEGRKNEETKTSRTLALDHLCCVCSRACMGVCSTALTREWVYGLFPHVSLARGSPKVLSWDHGGSQSLLV